MPELKSPYGGGVIEVDSDLAPRFLEGGWTEQKKAPAKKVASPKSDK